MMTTKFPFKSKDPNEFIQELGISAPINLDEIADKLGIHISRDMNIDRLGYSGEASVHDGKRIIWVNPADHENRSRFTFAHEIGHHVLHLCEKEDFTVRDDMNTLRRGGKWNQTEAEANRFAAKLLMPKHLIIEESNNAIINNGGQITYSDLISALHPIFKVSHEAMRYRLINLGIIGDNKSQ